MRRPLERFAFRQGAPVLDETGGWTPYDAAAMALGNLEAEADMLAHEAAREAARADAAEAPKTPPDSLNVP